MIVSSRATIPTFVCLTNIPAPYRLHLFEVLARQLEARSWKLEVWFMAKTEQGRHWKFEAGDFRFPHRFLRGTSIATSKATFHLNPEVLLRSRAPEILLVGGAWLLPTSILAALSSRLIHRSKLLFWSESHLGSVRVKGGFMEAARRNIFRLYDGFVVPGEKALEYVRNDSPAHPAFHLPNTVNESVFQKKVSEQQTNRATLRDKYRLLPHHRALVTPARLIHEKGILPFLHALGDLPETIRGNLTFLLAGDGHLKADAEAWTKQNPSIDVRLLGHRSENEIVELYAAADGFLLPSFSDPNPLSVIEALWAGLPLLLSDRIGNHPEALKPEVNGWLFDPASSVSVNSAIEKFWAASNQQLCKMGETSAKTARVRFDTETAVENFLNQLLTEVSRN